MSTHDPERWPADANDNSTSGLAFADLAAGAIVAFGMALAGGLLLGWMIDRFGSTGAIGVWPLGFFGGLLVQKYSPFRYGGIAVSIGLVGALLLGEVLWIQSNIVQADDQLSKAFLLFPTFLAEYEQSAFIAVIFLVFGILSALRTAASPYRRMY